MPVTVAVKVTKVPAQIVFEEALEEIFTVWANIF